MKLAFSTLGVPKWATDQILQARRESGYAGVELRFYEGSMDLPTVIGALPGGAEGLAQRFAAANLAVCCTDSSVVLTKPETEVTDGEKVIDLAVTLKSPYIRVFGGAVPEGESLESRPGRGLRISCVAWARMGPRHGVRVLLETRDAFSTGASVADLLRVSGEEGIGVIWDVHHPHELAEPLADTVALIGAQTYHVHVKDGKSDGTLTLLGDGDLPLKEILTRSGPGLHRLPVAGMGEGLAPRDRRPGSGLPGTRPST